MLANCEGRAHVHTTLMPRIHKTSAFTLLELMLAVLIALIVMGIAIPSMRGLNAEKRLRESYEKVEALAYKAQTNAITQQRTWVLVWEKGQILLQPDAPTAEEKQAGTAEGEETMAIGEDETLTMQRPASLLPPKETPGEWPFWRSGTCEPVTVAYDGPEGTWTAIFHPLTAKGEITEKKMR